LLLQQLGNPAIAALRHRLQSELDKSGVHWARLYIFWNALKDVLFTANFLAPGGALAARAAKSFAVAPTRLLKRWGSVVIFCVFNKEKPGL
jgi:hypothetical protein